MEVIWILGALKTIAGALGFVVIYRGFRAYTKRRERHLLWLTLGVALLTVGIFAEGAAYQFLGWNLDEAHLLEAVVSLAGFGALVYSLYA